jgi:hypothetical protein
LTWNPEKWKGELKAQLVANGEIVGKFVETDARRRLVAYEEPKQGRAYRQQFLPHLLTYVVEDKGNEVVISVGMEAREGVSGRYHGFYIETGSSTAPAQPYLRPAVFENGPQIVALLEGK